MDEAVDLGARELCVDGACIGIIGTDGHCKECGKPGPSIDADAPSAVGDDDDGSGEAPLTVAQEKPATTSGALRDDGALDLDSRRLCSDGCCIGVIGDDGRCRECGNPYEG